MAFGAFAPGASPLLDMVRGQPQPKPQQPGSQPGPAFRPGLLNSVLGVGGPGQGLLNRAWGSLAPQRPMSQSPGGWDEAGFIPQPQSPFDPVAMPDRAAMNGW